MSDKAAAGQTNGNQGIQWRERELTDLRSSSRNARTHSQRQIRQIADSISAFGNINPIIADAEGRIVAGHGRAAACKLLKLTRVPVIEVSHLSDTQLRAYALADNRIAEGAGWDSELLAIELKDLQPALADMDLQLDVTGFSAAGVDLLMGDLQDEQIEDYEELPQAPANPTARLGDVYVLGRHRLVVGDARDPAVYAKVLAGEPADMAFLDPPYNVPIRGHVGGRGKVKHKEFICGSGEMSPDEFTVFLEQTLSLCAQNTVDGAIHFVCMDWRHSSELLTAGRIAYDELKNICVWTKTSAGQGSFYRSQHEFVFVYKRGRSAHLNNFELGQHGRNRSNVWRYPGVNAFKKGRMDELKLHPTVKPIALVADAIKDCSRRGSIILDSFCGSGTSILAAEKVGRRAYCIELDRRYADVSIERWQNSTKQDAVEESTGKTFSELQKRAAPRKKSPL